MSFSVRARDVGRQMMTQWLIGMLATSSHLNDLDTVINTGAQAQQVSTITVDTVTNSATYTVTIDSIDVSYTADASALNTEIVAGLIAAIEDDPAVSAAVTCVATSSTVITLTARLPGIAFTITDSDAKLTTATTTAAAAAAAIDFGRLIIHSDTDVDTGNVEGELAKSSRLTAQVDTLTADYSASEEYNVSITIEGQTYGPVSVVANADDGTTATDIATAINAMMPTYTVVAAATSGGALTLTAEVAGKAFTVAYSVKSGTASRLTLAHTTSGVDTDITRAALGVTVFVYDEESTEAGVSTPSYPANASMKVLRKGDIAVECSESVSYGAPVYVELGVTADNGKFFATSSATRVLFPGAKWLRNEQSAADDDVAILRLG